jgi:asparagine synthase (glutamine-hydrolysing)
MPGIVGFTSRNTITEDPLELLIKQQKLITHKSFYSNDVLFSDGLVYATRSHSGIIQKHPQPFQKNNIFVWLDGEFYNQKEILPLSGITTGHDPDILCSLYEQNKGFSFLRNIDGFFSAIIYDASQKKIHLISDRYGLKHIYQMVHNNNLFWTSEQKTVLEIPGFNPRINSQSVDNFIDSGYLLEDSSWFDGLKLLPPGTVLTWDIYRSEFEQYQYWSWGEIGVLSGKYSEDEIADELGRLFIKAVRQRVHHEERTGLGLSGGLDSRAILAAIPPEITEIHAFTMGKKGCDDIRIAQQAAKIKGAIHHTFELDNKNWLPPRIHGIWWTDGQLSLLHMHGIETLKELKKHYDVNLNGFLADAVLGGSYLNDRTTSMFYKINNRGRRFIILGPKMTGVYFENRLPFFDNDLMEFTISLSENLREKSYIYNKMLLRTFPQYYRNIPWQKTGIPIYYPVFFHDIFLLARRVKGKVFDILSIGTTEEYTDYPNWIRQEPARSFFTKLLTSPGALYPQYISRNSVTRELSAHFSGTNFSEKLCRYLTFEIWLQQVFNKLYRNGWDSVRGSVLE